MRIISPLLESYARRCIFGMATSSVRVVTRKITRLHYVGNYPLRSLHALHSDHDECGEIIVESRLTVRIGVRVV
jgi:hypothetical protein